METGPILGITAACFLAACADYALPDPRIGAPVGVRAETSAPVRDGWQPNELQIERPAAPGSSFGPITYRVGTVPDGLRYRYYSDGDALLGLRDGGVIEKADWLIRCRTDAMTDAVHCAVTHDAADFVIRLRGRRPAELCAVKHTYPGRLGAVRVDDRSPVSTAEDGCVAWRALEGIANGTNIVVRSVRFPYDRPVDAKGSLRGLAWALSLADYMFDNHGKFVF